MEIRELQWRDFEPLVEAYWALYEEVLDDPEVGISLFAKRPSLGEEAEWFARMFHQVHDGKAVAVVGDEGGKAVGLCGVSPKGTTIEGAHIGVLGISVARSSRGKGIGRRMMVDALRQCRGKFQIVELVVFATNGRARALYESLGFRVWGTQPRAIRRGERYIDAVYMQLELAPARPDE